MLNCPTSYNQGMYQNNAYTNFQQPQYGTGYNYNMPQNFQQTQVQQPQGQQSMLIGRTVSDFNQITAQEVPMSGDIAVFPKQDLTQIVVKHWNSNGTISDVVYVPQVAVEEKVENIDPLKNLDEKIQINFDSLNSRLTKIEEFLKPHEVKSNTSQRKKVEA